MSLAALGCNPEHKGATLADIGGAALGTLAYSPPGGLYIAIRAAGAIGQYDPCFMEGGYDIDQVATGATHVGKPVCIPQVALADNEYGWALIAGDGLCQTDGALVAGAQVNISSAGHLNDGAADEIGAAIWVEAAAAAGTARIFLAFPSKVA